MTEVTDRFEEARPRRFRPYPEYRESGVEWLGGIPAHWEPVRLWRLCSATSGATPTKENPAYWNGEVPWVSPKDMKRRVIATSEDLITQQALDETGIKLITPQVILVVVRGMILAHSFPVAVTAAPVTINQDMKALRLIDGVDAFYFAWALDGLARGIIATVVEEAAHGTRAIRMDQWRSLVVPLPPHPEQEAIAAFLDRETAKIDALVARKERLIELLQEKRTALITRAVTRGLNPDVPMKDSGVEWLGEIPAHWEPARLWRLCTAISGATPSKENLTYWNGEIPWVSPKDMKRRVIATSEDLITQQALDEAGIKLIAPQVVLVVVRGMILAHSFPVAVTAAPVTINQDMKALMLIDGVDCSYFAWALDGLAPGLIATVVEEAAHGTRAIRMDQWRNVVCPVPPYPEQRAIVNFLDRKTVGIDSLIAKVKAAVGHLREFRTALISAAVTGKIDVRATSAEASAGHGGTR